MISPTTPQKWVPDGLYAIAVPPCLILKPDDLPSDVFATAAGQTLIRNGARWYAMPEGGMLSLREPAGAVAKGINVQRFLRAA